jgi:hypothetical protein
MFWLMYYTMYVEDFIELYASQWGAQICLWTQTALNVVAGTWTMLLYLPLLLVLLLPHLTYDKNKSYCGLYQVVGMLSIKVYVHAVLIFLGKTVQRARCMALSTHTTTWNTCCHNIAKLITMYFFWLNLQKCNFSHAQCKLSEDGPSGMKHVGSKYKIF